MLNKFLTILVLFYACLANGASWEEEVDGFVVRRLGDLRSSRSIVKREKPGIGLAAEILDLLIKSVSTHGVEVVANSDYTAELIVDLSDIINLQSPDFKDRYNIFVEQWVKKGEKKPFSLWSFDRIAQAFKYRDRIFNIDTGSPYACWIEGVFREEVPNLYRTMRLIRDLEIARDKITGLPRSHRGYGYLHGRSDYEGRLLITSEYLDMIAVSKRKEKARWESVVRNRIPTSNLHRLATLTAMAHDYFVLERIEKAADIVLAIPSYDSETERQAFLAGMIQIGELATNKNLSKFVKYHAERVPWDELVHIRDAIEHQDEKGWVDFFEGIVGGTDTSVSLKVWREELNTLKKQVKEVSKILWKGEPKTTYDLWLEAELDGSPMYGVVEVVDVVPVNEAFRRTFKTTHVFRSRKAEWNSVLKGERNVKFRDLFQVNQLLESDQIRDLEGIQTYLYETLKRKAIHLKEDEKELLIETIRSNLDKKNIVNICLWLLNKDREVLDPRIGLEFIKAFEDYGLVYIPFGTIYTKIHPVMHLTRRIAGTLGYDSSKDMDQPTRRAFSLGQLRKTQNHLHDLAHGGPRFKEEMLSKLSVLPIQYAFTKATREDPEVKDEQERIGKIHEQYGTPDEYGYYQLSEEGSRLAFQEILRSRIILTFPNPTDPEFLEFSKDVMSDFYRKAHKFHLPTAVTDKPAAYLASVYTLSVGLGSFKSWLSREPVPPVDEVRLFEELREERNFIAHGDLLREMHNVDLGKVHIEMLTGYLDACRIVGAS